MMLQELCIHMAEIKMKWQVFVTIYSELREKKQTLEVQLQRWRMQVERSSDEVDDIVKTNLGNEVRGD